MKVRPSSLRSVRIGDTEVARGTVGRIGIPLEPRAGKARALPIIVIAGRHDGPRVTLLAAGQSRDGFIARALATLATRVDATAFHGTLLVCPALDESGLPRPPGVKETPLPLPGDPGGTRSARDGFRIYSHLCVGSDLVVMLTAPRANRRGVPLAIGSGSDARVLRHVAGLGISLLETPAARPGTLSRFLASAAGSGLFAIGLCFDSARDDLAHTLDRLLIPPPASATRPALVTGVHDVHSPSAGFLRVLVAPGQRVGRRAPLATVEEARAGRPVVLRSTGPGVVLEVSQRPVVRKGATVALVGTLHASSPRVMAAAKAGPPVPPSPERLVCGWAERVFLPALGGHLRAKIDTGARTSALHVVGLRQVGTTAGPYGKPIIEFRLPGSGSRPRIRTTVRDHVSVRDSGGKAERRPVVETDLVLGTLRRRIRLTLTHRGDMLFPMLVGRTALPDDVLVDPSRRYLLGVNSRARGARRPR